MGRLKGFLGQNPAGVSMTLVSGGLILGALLGGQLGCFLYTKHMAFLHDGAVRACGDSPLILWGGTASGAFIGAGCGILCVVLIYLRGRLTTYFSLAGAALSVAGFSIYAMDQGSPFENFLFTGAFVALAGLTAGAAAGLIADHLKSRPRD